jgi:Ca-activated chloride channel family protein
MRRIFLCLAVLLLCSLHEFGGALSTLTSAMAQPPGSLSAFTRDGDAIGACPLEHTDVLAEISGIPSNVKVTERFSNPFREPIEAVYTFPLPHDAAVNETTIHVGERVIRSVIKRREEARAEYERARSAGKLAALLDQERPNIFTQNIANILPGQRVDVTIRYLGTLRYADDGCKFVFPMVVGPRYIPGSPVGREGGGWAPDTDRVPDASRITPHVAEPGTRAGHHVCYERPLLPVQRGQRDRGGMSL